jgi:hypothetical protein
MIPFINSLLELGSLSSPLGDRCNPRHSIIGRSHPACDNFSTSCRAQSSGRGSSRVPRRVAVLKVVPPPSTVSFCACTIVPRVPT